MTDATPDHSIRLEFDFQLDQGRSMGRTGGKGRLGPVVYDGPDLWRTETTPAGPGTLRIRRDGETAHIDGWGPGLEPMIERVSGFLGGEDDPTRLVAHHPIVARWAKENPHRRMTATGTIWEHLIPTITGQKVPGPNNMSAWQGILRRWGHTAPGPGPETLVRPPDPDVIAGLAYHEFHRFDVERRRAQVIVEVGKRWRRLEEAAQMEGPAARKRLEAINGIGPWTSSIVTMLSLGDPDAVIVGDYWIPSYVTHHLVGESRSTDERMLEVLEPYKGQRARVQSLAKMAGGLPRYGHRMSLVDLQGR
ncbi:MAG: 3-methyladenine DNA glycosylase/8-oxoguanine DNA glycosylase [Candidatus Poriferisodalaceae bacterium]|jgi:3-methyladenine DNA glycosylase/8-oxoguanine DNA glycosylase